MPRLVAKIPRKSKTRPKRISYFDAIEIALADIPRDGEQEILHYDNGKHRWEELDQKINEVSSKPSFIKGKFGSIMPERAAMIRDAWQHTLRTIWVERLAAERNLAQAMAFTGAPRSLDEVLADLEKFHTLEEKRAYLVGADQDAGSKILQKLAEFQAGVQERYHRLLAVERHELHKSCALDSPYAEIDLQQLTVEIRGYSSSFIQAFEKSPTLAEILEIREDQTHLLNPLRGPRAAEIVEELQLRYAASKLQSLLQQNHGNEQQAHAFLITALQLFAPHYEHVAHAPWEIIRRELGLQ